MRQIMKILVYVRKFSRELFENIVNEVFPEDEKLYFSDFKHVGDIWAGTYIYNKSFDNRNPELDKQMEDIVCRDRSLRKMDKERRERLVTRYWNGIDALFRQENFEELFTHSVDCYGIDILIRIANKYKVHVISFTGSFIGGYSWFHQRGERHPLDRNVSQEEAKKVLNKLIQKRYLPPSEHKNVKRTAIDIYLFFYRRKLVENIYYPLRKILEQDPDNYHYNMFNWKGEKLRDYYNNDYEKYFLHVNEIDSIDEDTVYFPLHYIPEDTTDYWNENIPKITYHEYVYRIIKKSNPKIKFLIKEHPAMYGKRKIEFYRKISKFPNVIIIHPLDASNDLLEKVQNVLVDNGTVGVEALLRGKRVISLSENYYSDLHPNITVVNELEIEHMHTPLVEYDNLIFMQNLLDGLFKTNFVNNKHPGDSQTAHQIAKGVKVLLVKEKS